MNICGTGLLSNLNKYIMYEIGKMNKNRIKTITNMKQIFVGPFLEIFC